MLTLAEMMSEAGMLRSLELWLLLVLAVVALVLIAVALGAKKVLTAPLRLLKKSKPDGADAPEGPGKDGA